MIRMFFILLLALQLFSEPTQAAAKGVVLNFNEVDIATMVKFISDLTGRNFILDDRVRGKISVYSPSKLSINEAYDVFVSVLELKGFTVVQTGRVAKIIPIANAKQSGVRLLPQGEQAPVNESYVAQVAKLQTITAQEAVSFLRPLVSKDGHLSVFGPGNLILMVDSSINIRKLQAILADIDTERTRDGLEIIYLKNASADSAAAVIRQWLMGGSDRPAGQAGSVAANAGMGNVIADMRLNALLVFGSDTIKKSVREMVSKLDAPPPETGGKVNVYYLENSDAVEMAKVLDDVIKGSSSHTSAIQQDSGVSMTVAGSQASPFDAGRISVTADKSSNSLVIMASNADYTNLVQVIKKLDRRSRQVFVKAIIAEVSLDKTRELGVQSGAIGGAALNKYLTVAGLYDPQNTLSMLGGALDALSNVVSPANISSRHINVTAVIKALETNDLIKVLSTPNILTSDNKEAEINVGENVPFRGATTISNGMSTTSVDRKDVGIKLKITPQISEGDYIRLKIEQEVSAVKSDRGDAVDLVTTTRSAKTDIVIKDRETIVIGGLIQDSDEEVVTSVPFLGRIPLLGWLFKTKTKAHKKTNLLILLTPSIIRDAADLATVSDDQRNAFDDAANSIAPIDIRRDIGAHDPKRPDGQSLRGNEHDNAP